MLGGIGSFRRDHHSSSLVSLHALYLNHSITSLLIIPRDLDSLIMHKGPADFKTAEAASDLTINGPRSLLLFQRLNLAVKLSNDAEDCSE